MAIATKHSNRFLNRKVAFVSILLTATSQLFASIIESAPFKRQPNQLQIVLKDNVSSYRITDAQEKQKIQQFCSDLEKSYEMYHWKKNPCGSSSAWKADLVSLNKHPLIYSEFGEGKDVTLILGGVHPDEITPIYVTLEFANYLQKNPDLVKQANARVVIAPLVNPDGFFRKGATRTNSNGVDLNRNFFTGDWYARAKPWWAERRGKNANHFPGHIPNSEIETLFQIQLIERFHPSKIISLHAPLGFYDYDGPGTKVARAMTDSETKAKRLVHSMSQSSNNYRIIEYSYYPGSLGNYAGIERSIPTVTLELESTDPRKAEEYWNRFKPSLEQSFKFKVELDKGFPNPTSSLFLEMYNLVQGT